MNKCRKRLVLMLVLIFTITPGLATRTVQASSTTQGFDTSTGVLDVNYAGYLSKHDVVFNYPITEPKSGVTVGNGRVGAQVWNTNGLTMQISGVDASEQGFASQGLVNLYTNPGMDKGYSAFQQRLSLYDGLMTTKYDSNRTVTIMGSPNSEVLGIHVEDSRVGVAAVALDLSLWDVNGVSGGNAKDTNTWRTVSTLVDQDVAGLSRGQADPDHFGYTLAASVEGASYTTEAVDSKKVRLNITPSSSYTIWIACASRLNAPGYDSVAQAKNLLTDVKSAGYNTTLENYKQWWHDFWSKSFVQYSNASGDADYMESMYYLSNYIIASGAYGNYPFHFINGVYSGMNDNDSEHWSFAYWYWNQRDVYNSFYASNHPEIMETFNNLYSRNFNALKAYTQSTYGIDGIRVPEVMSWNGYSNDDGDYTKNIFSTGTEAAQNMYLQYKYTNDLEYLRNTAYPFMKEICKFYVAKLSYNAATGKYYMASSNAHETYWNVKNAITDLAAVRALFPITISASAKLGISDDAALCSQLQNILDKLQPYPVSAAGNSYLPNDLPSAASHNNENVVCELLWPYNVSGIDAPDYSKLLANWNSRPYPYGNVWSPDAIQAARLGLGDEAYNGMKTMLKNYQNYPNSRTTNTNGEFEYHGVHLSAMNESLLQSYNDKIRVFPALPSDTNFVSKFTLAASGGFLVSSEKENDEIKYVGIRSLYGNAAAVINPWGNEAVQVKKASDNTIITATSDSEITFDTDENTVYIIERTAKPFSSYTHEQLTGTANQTVKHLNATDSKLGSDTTGGYVTTTTFYADSNFGGTARTLPAGEYTTAQLAAEEIPDNWASSVKVPAGYTAQVYDGDNFTGTKWTFIADNADFPSAGCNDRMSSVKIYANKEEGIKYEAEDGILGGGTEISADGAASNGSAVSGFSTVGSSLSFSNVAMASKIVIGYCTGNSPGKLSLYINGTHDQDITFPYNGTWSGGYALKTVTAVIPAGAVVKFQLDDGDSGTNIDYIITTSLDLSNVSVDQEANQITGTTAEMEYSLDSTDGTDGIWTSAKAGNTFVVFSGGKVYIREAANHDNVRLLATIPFISGQYEAEDAELYGGAVISPDNHTGYSGTGFVDGYFNKTGASTRFSVNAAAQGPGLVTLRYSAGGGTSTNTGLYVNGTKIKDITCNDTGDWDTWSDAVEVVNLNSGSNTIEYRSESNSTQSINLDYITVEPSRLEAENGILSGGAAAETDHPDYSGTAFVGGYYKQNGVSTLLNLNNVAAGAYSVALRYAAAGETRLSLYVNGTKLKQMTLPSSGGWDSWATVTETLTLKLGRNTIEYRRDAGDNSSVNLDCIDVTPLVIGSGAPTWPRDSQLMAANVTQLVITLSWTQAEDDTAVAGYRVYSGTELLAEVTGTTYEATGLTSDTTYTFVVQAGDEAGNWSKNGPSVSVKTLPEGSTQPDEDTAAPTWPRESEITASDVTWSGLVLAWTAAEDDTEVTGYRLYNGAELLDTVTGTTYEVEGLTPDTTYTFAVQAGDAAGNWSTTGPSISVTTAEDTESNQEFLIGTPVFKDAAGNILDSLAGRADLRSTVKITNNSEVSGNACLILALYAPDGTFKNISYVEGRIEAGKSYDLSAGFVLPPDVTGYYVKIFVWDSINGMRALTDAFKFSGN